MTLTHSKIISLDYAAFLRGMTRYSTVKAEIEAEMEQLLRNTDTDDRQNLGFNLLLKYSKGNERNTFIMFKECINMHRYCKNQPTPTSYWEPFKKWGKFRFFQFLLLPIVISPQSKYFTLFLFSLSLTLSIHVLHLSLFRSVFKNLDLHTNSFHNHFVYDSSLIFLFTRTQSSFRSNHLYDRCFILVRYLYNVSRGLLRYKRFTHVSPGKNFPSLFKR